MIRTVSKEEHKEEILKLLKWYRKRILPYNGDTSLANVLVFIKELVESKEKDQL